MFMYTCVTDVFDPYTPCLAPMLRIGPLRGSGRKRASRKLAALKHPAVLSACGLHCSALRPRGPNTNEDRRADASPRSRSDLWSDNAEGESFRNAATRPNLYSAAVPATGVVPPRLYSGPVWSDEKHRAEGCPAHGAGAASLFERRQSDASSGRIPSPLRVAVNRREAPALCPGVFFLCLLSFGQAKESESHSSAKQ